MKIQLLDWAGNPKWVEVPDDTERVSGVILSGDMVMEKPIHADASDDRFLSFYDGAWEVRREDFDKLNSLSNSYDVFDI